MPRASGASEGDRASPTPHSDHGRSSRSAPGEGPLEEGETVLVLDRRESHLLRLAPGPVEIPRLGVIDLSSAIGRAPGHSIDWAGGTFRVVRPVLEDFLSHLGRTTQVVTPKDAQYLLFLLGARPGDRIIEAGCGTGALTTVLAYAVGRTGRIVAFDRREEFIAGARGNLQRFGLADRVEFRLQDVVETGLGDEPTGAVALDLPEPWRVVGAARAVLAPGGRLAVFTPTYNQLERTVRALRESGFARVRSTELLERHLHVGDGGTRPEFDMLGHTGFLTGAMRWD